MPPNTKKKKKLKMWVLVPSSLKVGEARKKKIIGSKIIKDKYEYYDSFATAELFRRKNKIKNTKAIPISYDFYEKREQKQLKSELKKMQPVRETKRIEGKLYNESGRDSNKKKLQKYADELRNSGYNARVLPYGKNQWSVWSRKKR